MNLDIMAKSSISRQKTIIEKECVYYHVRLSSEMLFLKDDLFIGISLLKEPLNSSMH